MIKEVIKTPADPYIDSRPRFIQLIDLLNNFFIGFIFSSFLWAFAFVELARMLNDAIALHCGAK